MTALVFAALFIDSVGETYSMAMQAVWGYKAKLFYRSGAIPLSFFTDADLPFTHQSYPLIYPVMLTWSYFCMFGDCDVLLKVLPPLLGVLIYLSIYRQLRCGGCGRNVSLTVALLFCGSAPFFLTSTTVYAENLLILYVFWGVSFLLKSLKEDMRRGDVSAGLLLLAGGACVKNEGLIYFTFAVVFILSVQIIRIFRCKKVDMDRGILKSNFLYSAVFAVAAFALFILPWLLFRKVLGIEVRDFDIAGKLQLILEDGFVKSGSMKVLKETLKCFGSDMFVNLKTSVGVWYCLLLSLFFMRRRVFRVNVIFLLWITIMPLLIYAGAFIFSTRELGWHLDSVKRLLLLPMLFAWLVISKSFCSEYKLLRV